MCTYLNKTGATYYFRRPVPDDLAGHFMTKTGNPRTEWKFSLGTKDRETAKRLLRPHEVETDALIDEARKTVAERGLEKAAEPHLAPPGDYPPDSTGTVPQGLQERREEISGERDREEREAKAALDTESQMRRHLRSDLRTLWRKRRMTSTAMLEPEQAAAVDLIKERDAKIEQLERAIAIMQAGNDALGIARPAGRSANIAGKPRLSISVLYERYAESGAANPKTISKWRGRVESLIEHMGHDDASRIQRADLNGWVATLIARGLSKKTVRDGYLPAVRAALNIAFEDGAIPANPAAGLKVLGPKAVKLREPEHSDEEATTILSAALGPQPAGLADHHARARRWVPWLCAYTGARVGEITQLRAMDIQQEGGVWFVHISPEADGGVKTGEARKVPLHSHLVEQGFTEFAKAGDASPLFFQDGTGTPLNPASKMRASALSKWIRTLGVETPQPNHGWRHKFKTMCRAAEIPEHVMDKLQGHASPSQGRRYGTIPLGTLRGAIEKLPRFEV